MATLFATTPTLRCPGSSATLRLPGGRSPSRVSLRRANRLGNLMVVNAAPSEALLAEAKAACANLVRKSSCAPILVRLAW